MNRRLSGTERGVVPGLRRIAKWIDARLSPDDELQAVVSGGICLCRVHHARCRMGLADPLPWGNMSYWGAQVIVSLFGAIPGIGESLSEWIRGDYYISDITLNRFFALHVIALPVGEVRDRGVGAAELDASFAALSDVTRRGG